MTKQTNKNHQNRHKNNISKINRLDGPFASLVGRGSSFLINYMTVKEFKHKLEIFDWWYVMSDDPRKYDQDLEEENEIKRIAASDEKLQKLYDNKIKSIYGTNSGIKK